MKIDLSPFIEETFDVQFDTEGKDVIKVKKPTRELALKIAALQVQEKRSNEEYLDDLDKLTSMILNWNTDNSKQDARVKKLPLDIKMRIVQGYAEFMRGIESNPN